ncbi:MAG: NADH-quinone oxidoreductase subunit N [Candidatus Eremiobacteraeota bacterium]|nr:NADH-quinone oxidoreductase subunit N [Candidatus Eremiobacteraeota bacterium]
MISNPFTALDWMAVWPLLVVAATALVVLFADLVAGGAFKRPLSIAISLIGLVVAGYLCARTYGQSYSAFGGGFIVGGFAVVFQELILLAAIFSVALYAAVGESEYLAGSLALMLWSTSGAMLMAGAGNLLTIFLGLELLSLALYCLCGMSNRRTARESALKYLILSSTATGVMLYGMALFFGASGSVNLAALAAPSVANSPLFIIGCGLFLIGLAFKLSLVPFHVWTPDVYEGAPLPVTAYMSVATKAGALAVFARFAYAVVSGPQAHAVLYPMWIIAGLSMLVGNLAALAQTDVKRLLAYSGIAQVGYIVAAFAGSTPLGLRYAIFYLAAYLFMNLGAFAVVALLSTQNEEGSRIAAYHGLARRRPLLAAMMTFFLLALAGFPPTAGFIGKILILSSLVSARYAWLAALLILGTAISLYVYFKLIRLMYERHEPKLVVGVNSRAPLAWLSVALCAVATLALTLYPLTPSNVLPLVK